MQPASSTYLWGSWYPGVCLGIEVGKMSSGNGTLPKKLSGNIQDASAIAHVNCQDASPLLS